MNIKEVTEIFDDEILQNMEEIKFGGDGVDLTIIDGSYLKMTYVLRKKQESRLNFETNNLDEFTLVESMMNHLFKIKTQWEAYLNKPSKAEKAFDDQMEKETMFEHLKNMSIKKEKKL